MGKGLRVVRLSVVVPIFPSYNPINRSLKWHFSGPVDQSGRSPPWHGGGREFKSRPVHHLVLHGTHSRNPVHGCEGTLPSCGNAFYRFVSALFLGQSELYPKDKPFCNLLPAGFHR